MGLKALVLAVMESDRGENARKLWQTEGLMVEYTVRDSMKDLDPVKTNCWEEGDFPYWVKTVSDFCLKGCNSINNDYIYKHFKRWTRQKLLQSNFKSEAPVTQ